MFCRRRPSCTTLSFSAQEAAEMLRAPGPLLRVLEGTLRNVETCSEALDQS